MSDIPSDQDPYDSFRDFLGWAEEDEDWNSTRLLEKYGRLKSVTLENIPALWPGLEFALSVKGTLHIRNNTLPFAGIILGPPSSTKTLAVECFRESDNTFYTDNFSPKSLVSHNSAFSEEKLREIDLLPKIKNKFFLTPELAPIFSLRDDELLQVLGILTRVLDGHGYESDTGAQGHRGYNEEIMFTWIGAVVDISWKVHKMLGNLGPKLYFFRLPRQPSTVEVYHRSRNGDFARKMSAVRMALFEYLEYFELNPDIVKEECNPVSKIEIDRNKDDELADYIIIRLGMLLAHLRAVVPTWDTSGTQGSEYGYTFANIEDPSRAITQLRNLAWGHALSTGRNHFTMEDIPLVIHTALSTASMSRVRIFEFLISNKGTVTTDQIVEFLNISRPTALRTMTELKATELVDMVDQEPGVYNSVKEIRLRNQFNWFLSDEFKELKERASSLVNILCKEKLTPRAQRQIDDNIPSDSNDNHNNTDTDAGGGDFSLHQNIIQKSVEIVNHPNLYKMSEQPSPIIKIRNTYADSSQILLLKEPTDFLFQHIHPSVLDNSVDVEFVTSKTRRKLIYLQRRPYYYSCYYCYDIHKATFDNLVEYERHIVNGHKPGTAGYPGRPDLEKYDLERIRRKQEFSNKGNSGVRKCIQADMEAED
jgi:predicted transcriptional regulator